MLEVGYGGGGLLRRLRGAGPGRLVGIDVSTALPRVAGAELVVGEARALPFADESFDGAVSVSVLHFWPDLEPPLRELARVLRRGGQLVLVFETPDSLREWKGSRHGFHFWNAADLRRAAREAGLALEAQVEGAGRKPDYFVGLRFRKGAA